MIDEIETRTKNKNRGELDDLRGRPPICAAPSRRSRWQNGRVGT